VFRGRRRCSYPSLHNNGALFQSPLNFSAINEVFLVSRNRRRCSAPLHVNPRSVTAGNNGCRPSFLAVSFGASACNKPSPTFQGYIFLLKKPSKGCLFSINQQIKDVVKKTSTSSRIKHSFFQSGEVLGLPFAGLVPLLKLCRYLKEFFLEATRCRNTIFYIFFLHFFPKINALEKYYQILTSVVVSHDVRVQTPYHVALGQAPTVESGDALVVGPGPYRSMAPR
jgi:hypothetical protein